LHLVDRERILAKIDELDGYLRELKAIAPQSFEEYQKIEKRRSCERLLQLSIECVIDTCAIIVAGLRLGLPAEEDDIFEKLEQAGIISSSRKEILKKMRAFRNLLVHEYGRIEDRFVYNMVKNKLDDFQAFKQEILEEVSRRS
jgi:uncharacterized protein YutE (UPF0331/DUF86 family)